MAKAKRQKRSTIRDMGVTEESQRLLDLLAETEKAEAPKADQAAKQPRDANPPAA